MSGKIHITSFEALGRLEAVLGIFAEDVTDKIQSVGRNMENQLAEIDNRCQELEREIGYWESEYEQADFEEDDIGYLVYKRQEAEEKLHQAQNLQRQAEEASENFARCARRVNLIADERINEARNFLRQKIKELQDYNAVQLESSNFAVSSLSNATLQLDSLESNGQIGGNLSLSKSSVDELEKIPLPKGFKWVRLDEISFKEIPDDLAFRNGYSYEKLKNGLQKFEKEILPVLQKSPKNSNTEYFESLDIKNDNNAVDGLTPIFNGFFNKEFIKIERFANEKMFESITNGRHRLKVARDLGWKVIPAEVTESNLNR